MKNIVTRSISGIIYISIIVGTLLAGPDWFMCLAALFAVLAMYEFQALTCAKTINTVTAVSRLTDIAAVLALCISTYNDLLFIVCIPTVLSLYIITRCTVALCDKGSDVFASAGRSALSILYIGMPIAIAAITEQLTHDRNLILFMFILIWLNDTGAYCVGSMFGKHRLCERLSPKKSWEGFWGGMFFCIVAGFVYGICLYSDFIDIAIQVGLGIVVCVFATWGDLFESLIKRSFGVKDSGKLIPGHGGILDRIDSLLFVAPATFIYAILTGII